MALLQNHFSSHVNWTAAVYTTSNSSFLYAYTSLKKSPAYQSTS